MIQRLALEVCLLTSSTVTMRLRRARLVTWLVLIAGRDLKGSGRRKTEPVAKNQPGLVYARALTADCPRPSPSVSTIPLQKQLNEQAGKEYFSLGQGVHRDSDRIPLAALPFSHSSSPAPQRAQRLLLPLHQAQGTLSGSYCDAANSAQLTSTAVRKAVDQLSAVRDLEWRRRDRRAEKEREGLVRVRREEREWVGDLPRAWPGGKEGEEDEAERCVVVLSQRGREGAD